MQQYVQYTPELTQPAAVQCSFEEETETSLGPFTSTARLTSVGGGVLYGTGKGRVSPHTSPASCYDISSAASALHLLP